MYLGKVIIGDGDWSTRNSIWETDGFSQVKSFIHQQENDSYSLSPPTPTSTAYMRVACETSYLAVCG